MKKSISTTILILGLGTVLPATQTFAANETESEISKENAVQSWQESLKVQVELAKSKVSLLQARSELWLNENSEKAQSYLVESKASLDEALHSADEVTRIRIAKLKSQIDHASQLLKDKSERAESELRELADQSEGTLNAALTQAQARSTKVREEIGTRYALVQVKSAALKAQIALEIEKSPERAQQALLNAENHLQQAKSSASEVTKEQVAQLQGKVKTAQQAVRDETDKARSDINALVLSTEEHIQSYEETIKETEEAKLMKKRYRQLQAKAALLQANLAAKTDTAEGKVAAYLEESKAWYDSLMVKASQRREKELADMTARIDDAKQAVKNKDKQARAKLAELLELAVAMLEDEESTE